LSYAWLSEVVEQWPIVGRGDLYYGGTGYENSQGLGVQLQPETQGGTAVSLAWKQPPELKLPGGSLLAVPVTRLYDRGQTLLPSTILEHHIPDPFVVLGPAEAERLGIQYGAVVQVSVNGTDVLVDAHIEEGVPDGVVLVPRSMGTPVNKPAPVQVKLAEREVA
jgi:NADH-quinone oxidoreductase subunit G